MNKELVIRSLQAQISNYVLRVAELESMLVEKAEELAKKAELEIKEMDEK